MASTPYIAPGIEIKIVFHKNRFNVPLLARDNDLQLKINFRDAKLRMRRFTLNEPAPQVLDYYFTKKQYYPINRVQMRMRTLPHGSSNIIIPQIVNGQIPWHLFCVLLKKEQQNDLNKDPFSYETHGIRDFTLLKNGFSVPSQPLVVDDASTDGEGKITTYKHFGVRYMNIYFKFIIINSLHCSPTWGSPTSTTISVQAFQNILLISLSWHTIYAETGVSEVMITFLSTGH